jgi:hypothetical protein
VLVTIQPAEAPLAPSAQAFVAAMAGIGAAGVALGGSAGEILHPGQAPSSHLAALIAPRMEKA